MASYTPNLNLEMPTVDEKYDVLKQNANLQKIDTGYGTLNDNLTPERIYDFVTDTSNFGNFFVFKIGKLVYIYAEITANATSGWWTVATINTSKYSIKAGFQVCAMNGDNICSVIGDGTDGIRRYLTSNFEYAYSFSAIMLLN